MRLALDGARTYAAERLSLEVKASAQVGPSAQGLSLCVYRILPGCLLLSRRRKRRYAQCRRQWEDAYSAGLIEAPTLQAGYSAALAINLHTDAAAWRRELLGRVPVAPVLAAL